MHMYTNFFYNCKQLDSDFLIPTHPVCLNLSINSTEIQTTQVGRL